MSSWKPFAIGTLPGEALQLLQLGVGDRPMPSVHRVRQKGTALLCEFRDGATDSQAVLKRVSPSEGIRDAEQLADVIRRVKDTLGMPVPLLPDVVAATRNWIMLEFVPGDPLDMGWRQCLRTACAVTGSEPFRQAGSALRRLHSVDAAAVGVTVPAPRANRDFLPRLEDTWLSPFVAARLPSPLKTPATLYDAVPASVFERTWQRLIPTDSSPKNSVLTPADGVRFIDPGFTWGNPAISAAFFLVHLDRSLVHARRPGSLATIRRLQASFADGYLVGGTAEMAEELSFFYPWALLETLRDHAAARPRLRWILRELYLRRFAHFMHRLRGRAESPPAGVTATRLFPYFDSDT